MACSSRCVTQDHDSMGACLRSMGIRVTGANSAAGRSTTAERKWNKNLADYRAARAEGIQPASTRPKDIEQAKILSDYTGQAFRA